MPIPALVAIGAAQSVLGGIGAIRGNNAEAHALRLNASYLSEQASLLDFTRERTLNIFDREQKKLTGAQISSFGKAGIELSGTALAVVAEDQLFAVSERDAINRDFEFRARLMREQAREARNQAKSLTSPLNQTLSFISGASSGAGNIAQGLA